MPPGSIVLFSFDGQVFGQAVVKEDIKQLAMEEKKPLSNMPDSVNYRYYLTLEPSSIEIFHFYPTKENVEESIDDLRFSQLFTYIHSDRYTQILKMARK